LIEKAVTAVERKDGGKLLHQVGGCDSAARPPLCRKITGVRVEEVVQRRDEGSR
jgi:hypothetical protein